MPIGVVREWVARRNIQQILHPDRNASPAASGLRIINVRELLVVPQRVRCLPPGFTYRDSAFTFALLLIRADQNEFRANQKERE